MEGCRRANPSRVAISVRRRKRTIARTIIPETIPCYDTPPKKGPPGAPRKRARFTPPSPLPPPAQSDSETETDDEVKARSLDDDEAECLNCGATVPSTAQLCGGFICVNASHNSDSLPTFEEVHRMIHRSEQRAAAEALECANQATANLLAHIDTTAEDLAKEFHHYIRENIDSLRNDVSLDIEQLGYRVEGKGAVSD